MDFVNSFSAFIHNNQLFRLSHFYYAVLGLFVLDFLFFLPLAHTFFDELPARVQRHRLVVLLFGFWLGCLGLAIVPTAPVRLVGLAGLWVIFRHFFIGQRWKSVRRGFGAPGFMAHWTIRFLFLFELGRYLDPSGRWIQALLLVYQLDLAVIMICAGTYKALSGYLKNDGMEYGRVNPSWGYHWRFFSQKTPGGWYPRLMNCLASLVEIFAGAAMLAPWSSVRALGALAITLSFFYVALFIRLGRLAFLMTVLPFVFWPSVQAELLQQSAASAPFILPNQLVAVLVALCWAYMAMLLLVKINQYYNLLSGGRTPPKIVHEPLTWFANWVPIIIWRVFTADIVNFYLRIKLVGPELPGGELAVLDESTYSIGQWPWRNWRLLLLKLRFLHVTESIALTSVFTTLKYFPSNRSLFESKLKTYSRVLLQTMEPEVVAKALQVKYEYVSVQKSSQRFVFKHVGDFVYDLASASVRQISHDSGFDYSAKSQHSPVIETRAPGTYEARART